MKKDRSVEYLTNAILFYEELCYELLYYACTDTIKGCLTLPQQQKLANLKKKYEKLSPWPETLNEYFKKFENSKKLADKLIEFYAVCYSSLQTNADNSLKANDKRIAWRWWNILNTARRLRAQALHHKWSEHLHMPVMHHTEWWDREFTDMAMNPYCV